MLYPFATESRVVMDLGGVWKFMLEDEGKEVNIARPLA